VQLRPVVCGKRLQRLDAVDNSRTSQVSPQYDPVKRVERRDLRKDTLFDNFFIGGGIQSAATSLFTRIRRCT
jgi:hypothetical protein